MSLDKTTYKLIANILSRSCPAEDLIPELKDYVEWERFVQIGSQQLVLPALYWSLDTKDLLAYLPQDLSNYLKEIYKINSNRNCSINKQLADITRCLKINKIDYALLKGSAIIQYLSLEDIGLRMIGDIDILINKEQIEKAQKLLITEGYFEGNPFNYQPKGHRHLNRLMHNNYIAAVELHSSVLNSKYRQYIDDAKILATAINKNDMLVCSKEELINSTIFALQITNKGHYYKSINFRAIFDCIILDLPSKTFLLKKFHKTPLTNSFIGISSYFFRDFTLENFEKNSKKLHKSLNQRFQYPHIFQYKLKIKGLFNNITKRIAIFLTNGSYRRHVIKNKIFPIFN